MGTSQYLYDVAISFAGEDRDLAQSLAIYLRDRNISVFYDSFERHDLVAKELVAHLSNVYSKESRFCVLLVSNNYIRKKWPSNVELGAVRERIMEEGGEYVIPILLDDTTLPGILNTIGHLDARQLKEQSIWELIAKKVLLLRYSDLPIKWKRVGFLKLAADLSVQEVFNILCETIYASSTTEIRISTFTPLKFFGNEQFLLTLSLLAEKMARENRTGTLRIYSLSDDQLNIENFTTLSKEPQDVLLEKIKNGIQLAREFAKKDIVKRYLRIQILKHNGISPMHACQIDSHYLLSSYKLGQKHDKYDIYYANARTAPKSFSLFLENIFLDLDMRSTSDTINWF